MGKEIAAVIIKSSAKYEIRCAKCGKLLMIFKFSGENAEIFKKDIDKSSQNVIIVARCTRNDCKTDNLVVLF